MMPELGAAAAPAGSTAPPGSAVLTPNKPAGVGKPPNIAGELDAPADALGEPLGALLTLGEPPTLELNSGLKFCVSDCPELDEKTPLAAPPVN